jgi:hypothetical protein
MKMRYANKLNKVVGYVFFYDQLVEILYEAMFTVVLFISFVDLDV